MNTATEIVFADPPLPVISNIINVSMVDSAKVARLDPILLPFVLAESDSQETELDQVLFVHVIPLTKRIIRHNFGGLPRAKKQDEEDLCSEVIARTLKRLRNLKEDPEAESIENLEDYIAVVIHNTWNTYQRRQFPERLRIKNRIRYALTNLKEFGLWKIAGSAWHCGMRGWQNIVLSPNRNSLEELKENASLLKALKKIQSPVESGLPDFLKEIFQCVGQPLELEELVTLVFTISGSVEQKAESEISSTGVTVLQLLPDRKTSPLIKMECRHYLKLVWEEIQQLPQLQRAALLLHLRDEGGNDVISLFHVVRIASITQIAEEIGMTAESLAGIWNDLPMDDLRIAECFQITRQQVINLRKSARKRLVRRMRVLRLGR